MSAFNGFAPPTSNFSKLPHALIDALPIFSSESELKLVLYIIRHTWGFNEYEQPRRLTIDELMNGRKRTDGARMDAGTGLSKPSVISGLRMAETHGFIEVHIDDSDKARMKKSYRIRDEQESVSFTPGVNKFDPWDVKLIDPSCQEGLHRSEKEMKINKDQDKSIAPIGATSPSSKKKRKPTTPIEDSAPTEDQSKSSNDVNAIISAWWEWVPLRPLLRGKVAEAKTHFANKTIRQHAENITKRGIGAADMARFLADVRFSTAGEKYFHLQEKPMGFTFAATILEEWVSAERAKRWYTWDQPRITPARPGLSRDATTTNEELRLDPDFIVDVPGPYVTAQEAANGKPVFNTDPDPEPEPSNSNDAAILRKLGIPL